MNRHPKTDDLDYRCCWTCFWYILDLFRGGHICNNDSTIIDGSPHTQVCDDWHR